jgi:peroxiredoxin
MILRRHWRLIAEVILIIAIFIALQWWLTLDAASGEAPPLGGVTTQGAPFKLQQQRTTPQIIYFWADWCPICSAMNSNLGWLGESCPVIGVAMQSGTLDDISRYSQQHQLPFDSLNDEFGTIAQNWGVVGVPMVFVLDRDNTIHFSSRGYTTTAGLWLRCKIARIKG